MRPAGSKRTLFCSGVLLAASVAVAQEIPQHVIYVCNGERIYVDGCNINDKSDNGTCMVEHPDKVNASGLAAITSETRGSLRKRLPACQQPTPQQLAAAAAMAKRQQAIQDANEKKANDQLAPATQQFQNAGGAGGIAPPKNAEERAMRRCISAGRLPASCTGNSLMGMFSGMVNNVMSSMLGSDAKDAGPNSGPHISGVYQGAGGWRVDFVDGGVLVNCTGLSPDQRSYKIGFAESHAVLTIDTLPRPLVLALRADGTMSGPAGPFVLDGVIASGTTGPSPNSPSGYTDKNGISLTNQQASTASEVYKGGNVHYGPVNAGASYTNFVHKRVTCAAPVLANKGGVGVQTMQTDLLKSMFSDGDKGPATPPGIRMHGIFASTATGFSAQFFPESVILGCGPDVARAYPYTVAAEGSRALVKVDAPDHPLTLTLEANGALDPGGAGPYLVHGRVVTGENDNGDFTMAPMEKTCNLAVLAPAKEIPTSGGVAAPAPAVAVAGANNAGRLSTPQAPLGNATLSIVSGLPAVAGQPNPLANHPYVLLRDSYAGTLAKGGVVVPAGESPYRYVADTCAAGQTPDCQKIIAAANASAISAALSNANGAATLPGVPPGTYYLMISTRVGNQVVNWGQQIQLKAGANSFTLTQQNATPIQ